jgi:hypothetical protein
MQVSAMAPIIVTAPIQLHPDGPNGKSPSPYPREATAPRMKNERVVMIEVTGPAAVSAKEVVCKDRADQANWRLLSADSWLPRSLTPSAVKRLLCQSE